MQVLRLTVVSGLLTLAACSLMGRSHWYNPDPNALFERDHQLSLQEAKRASVVLSSAEETELMLARQNNIQASLSNPRISFGQGLAGGLLSEAVRYNAAIERKKQVVQQQAYETAMARRGWRKVTTEEARFLGLIKP